MVGRRDRRTRRERWEQLDEELTYDSSQLDRDVVSVSQIRTVLKEYRDRLFGDIFPGRSEVPKTLVFAKDDSHAEDIVAIAKDARPCSRPWTRSGPAGAASSRSPTRSST